MGIGGLVASRLSRLGLGVVAIALIASVWTFATAIYQTDGRYLVPLLIPWLVLGATVVMGHAPPVAPRTFIWCEVAIIALFFARWPMTERGVEMASTAAWVNAHTSPSDVLLVHDAGMLSVLSPTRRAVDIIGLKTASSVPVHAALTYPSCGADRAQAFAQIARSSGASYGIVTNAMSGWYDIRTALTQAGAHLEPGRRTDLVYGYNVFRIDWPAESGDRQKPN